MDDTVNKLARDLAAAMAAAVEASPEVAECHARARAAGYEMTVQLEAVVGFAKRKSKDPMPPARSLMRVEHELGLTQKDGMFLRNLRIAPGDSVRNREERR